MALPPSGNANYTLAVLMIAYMLSFVDRTILSLLVGPIKQDLLISDFEVSLLQGIAFALFYVLAALPIARLSDNRNRKNIIAIGIFFWSSMTVACGLANSFSSLFLARIGVGIGESTLSPAAYSILADAFSPRRLPFAMAFYTMGAIAGAGLAFIVGGAVVNLVAVDEVISWPLVGTIASWKAALILVGTPGLLVGALALTIVEPRRQGLLRDSNRRADAKVTAIDVLRFVAKRWRAFGAITASSSAFAILAYSYLSWYPTFLIRTFGLTGAEAGIQLGVIYLVLGPLGAYCGPKFAAVLKQKGYEDANLRTVVLVALALVPLSIGPMMPSETIAIIVAMPTVFFINAYFGLSIASLQLITPNQMRASMSAMFLLAVTLIGLGFGPSMVAFMTDYVFGHESAVNISLTISCAISSLMAAIILMLGLGHYRSALREAAGWNDMPE